MKIKKELFDKLQKLNTGMLTDDGKELFNPMPQEIPSGLSKPEGLEERIARLIKGQLSDQAAQQDYETLEEADDFELNDPLVAELSGYELTDEEIPIMPDDPPPKPPEPPTPPTPEKPPTPATPPTPPEVP